MGDLISLDKSVFEALDFLEESKLLRIPFRRFKRPLVVGSGNASVAGRILFSDLDCVFASESDYLRKLKVSKVDGCFLISASGSKHAPRIARKLKKRGIEVILITNTPKSPASRFVSREIVFSSLNEPYTYNVSTYLSMIFSKTKEDPKKIHRFLKGIKIPSNLRDYDSFYLMIPERFVEVREMFTTKFDELFGSRVSGRCFSYEQTKHAKTIVESNKELFVGLGVDNRKFGKKRINYKLPKWASYGTLISLGYYFIGNIQRQDPPYFRKSLGRYLKRVGRIFGNQKK